MYSWPAVKGQEPTSADARTTLNTAPPEPLSALTLKGDNLLSRLFERFENHIDPFAGDGTVRPPGTLAAFYWHFVGQSWPVFALLLFMGSARASWKRLCLLLSDRSSTDAGGDKP